MKTRDIINRYPAAVRVRRWYNPGRTGYYRPPPHDAAYEIVRTWSVIGDGGPVPSLTALVRSGRVVGIGLNGYDID